MREPSLTSGERLGRHGQPIPSPIPALIVIGASAGGHAALIEILKTLPVDMPAAIVIIIHTRLDSSYNMSKALDRFSKLPIIDVKDRETVKPGLVFLPPAGKSVNFGSGIVVVDADTPKGTTNTINRLFTSAAQNYGEHVIGVILTGLLADGTDGLRAVHEAGGLTIVQDPREAEYPDMPANAMEKLPVTFCLNLADIGPALELLVRRKARFETGLQVATRTLRDRAALLVRLAEQSGKNLGTRRFLENELASLRRNMKSIDDLLKVSVPHEK